MLLIFEKLILHSYNIDTSYISCLVKPIQILSQLAVKSHRCSTAERRKPTLTPIQVCKGTLETISKKIFFEFMQHDFFQFICSKTNTNSKSSYPKQQYGGINSGVQRYYQSFQIKINISTSKSVCPSNSSLVRLCRSEE